MRNGGEPVSEKLRDALRSCEASYRQIGRETGIDHSHLVRFVNGERGLSLESMDAVAAFLGLELRRRTPKKRTRDEC